MAQQIETITRNKLITARPFTHPQHLAHYEQTLRYMASQVRVLLDYPYHPTPPPHIVFFNGPQNGDWFHRVVVAQPDKLRQRQSLTIVGFFGEKRDGADMAAANAFDRKLVAEIPDHPGILSYSTMAMAQDNYANLVLFSDREARAHWSTSKAHARAVQQLSPDYYHNVTIVNGRVSGGINHHQALTLVRAKYFDYDCQPHWHAIRQLTA